MIVDCNASPYVPEGATVFWHNPNGQFVWDREKQRDRLYVTSRKTGYALIEEIMCKPVLNANVLDALLREQSETPDWDLVGTQHMEGAVHFAGTIYQDANGVFVRCLCLDNEGNIVEGRGSLNDCFDGDCGFIALSI